jgi:hypothetical protein
MIKENVEQKRDSSIRGDYNSFLFNLYNKFNKSEPYIPHSININISRFILDRFIPSLYVSYVYDTKSSFNFAFIPESTFKKFKINYNITRDYKQLKFFDYFNDFEIEVVPTAADNSKYIKSIKNKDIIKLSTQQYLLKNMSRWIILDPSDNSKILAIYKNKNEIPEDKKHQAVEIIAKPKIIIRIFKNTKTNSLLLQFTRYFYNIDTLQFVNYKSRFEFTRYSLPVFLEFNK